MRVQDAHTSIYCLFVATGYVQTDARTCKIQLYQTTRPQTPHREQESGRLTGFALIVHKNKFNNNSKTTSSFEIQFLSLQCEP